MHDALADLTRSLVNGAIRVKDAQRLATDLGRRGEATPDQAKAVARQGLRMAEAGQWRLGLGPLEIGHAAAAGGHEAAPEDRQWAHAWLLSGSDLLSALHLALLNAGGDLRLYRRATELGEELLPTAGRYRLPRTHGLVLLDLGSLILDVYSRFPPEAFEQAFNRWIGRAQQGGDLALAGRSASDWPAPRDALRVAEDHLRDALPLVDPERQGRLLKALAQTMEWRGYFGDDPRIDELRTVAQAGLARLDPADAQARLYLGRIVGTDEEDAVTALEGDWPVPTDEIGQGRVWDALMHAADQVGPADPERALRLLDKHHLLPLRWADQAARQAHWGSEARYFAQAYGRRLEDFDATSDHAWQHLDKAATDMELRSAVAHACQVLFAASEMDREESTVSLIGKLASIAPDELLRPRVDAVVYLISVTLLGAAVNRVNASDPDAAIAFYRMAADDFRQLGLTGMMVSMLERIARLVQRDATETDSAITWLAANSLAMEVADPRAAPWAVLAVAEAALAAATRRGVEQPDALIRLLQVAKGRRFAAQLAAGVAESPLDERARRLLTAEREAERTVPAGDLLRRATVDLDDVLLAAWVDPYEEGPSETPADRLANIRRAIERHMTEHHGRLEDAPPIGLDEIRRWLDPQTALLVLYIGQLASGESATWSVLISRNTFQAAVVSDQEGRLIVHADPHGRSVTVTNSALAIATLRQALREDPGPLDVSRAAHEGLSDCWHRYASVVETNRPQLSAAGVEHLLVVPHGPIHHLPIHLLLTPAGQPLAADWTVSYLLNLAQLSSRPRSARRSKRAVFGLTYRDQPSLPRLDDTEEEVRAIAHILGTEPRLDAEVTPDAVLTALRTSRYVHLRAHGRIDIDAPSMHTVFLAGGQRLRAYEILGSDLRGLELVTLGACETALGRLDPYDNPRGLPAALFRAGAGAVIGTLWPVLAEACTVFFVRLYEELTTSGPDIVDAFAAAQRATRGAFPQYRDWGAFYLIGGQRERRTA
jgi:CHAT domain-containing protein